MTGRIKNGLLAGLGIVSLGRKKFLKIYRELIKEGETAKDESELLKSHWNKLDDASEKVEGLAIRIIEKANLATKSQIDRLNKKVDKLLKEAKSR
ncbi:hypothetical protein IBX73_09875 [candidate division WOR-3 bacterium]|nr:hypothetical protein [candidate division WOR-3 bacterium]